MAAVERGDRLEAGNGWVVRAAGRVARTGQCGRGCHTPNVRAALLCARTWSCRPIPVYAARGVRAGSRPCHTCGSYSDPNLYVWVFFQLMDPTPFFLSLRNTPMIRQQLLDFSDLDGCCNLI